MYTSVHSPLTEVIMSDSNVGAAATKSEVPSTETSPIVGETAPLGERLEGIDDIEFLLEEIENKIAPLALA